MAIAEISSLLFSFGILLLISSLIANLLVVFALTFKKRTRLPAFNILMLGLAVIALVDTLCSMPITAASFLLDKWPLESDAGLHLCRFHAYFISIVPSARIILIALMAVDRVVAIFSPVSYPDRITRGRAWCMVVYCWLHSSAVYVPLLAGAIPVSYRRYHYSCLISSSAPESYVIVLISFGYIIPVLFASIFLLMILKKYIVHEPVVSVVEDVNPYSQVQISSDYSYSSQLKRKQKSKTGYKSLSDYEVAAYVAILFLIWLVCQSPLFVTVTSDLIMSSSDAKTLTSQNTSSTASVNVNFMTTVSFNRTNETTSLPLKGNISTTPSINKTSGGADIDSYQQIPEFQTTIQFLNFIPTLLTPILTFALYRSVWSRLKHVIAKSRFARRRHGTLSVEDEELSSSEIYRGRYAQTTTTTSRSRQRQRHRNRLALERNSTYPDTTVTPQIVVEKTTEKNDTNRPPSRMGTPVLMATSDGLLLHQVIRNRPQAPGGDVGLEYVVDENGYFGNCANANGESDHDNAQVESDAMTSSCNSQKHLLHACDVYVEPITTNDAKANNNSDTGNDSGIEDSPSAKPKSDVPPVHGPTQTLDKKQVDLTVRLAPMPHSNNTMVMAVASASNIKPVLSAVDTSSALHMSKVVATVGPLEHHANNTSGVVANISEKARNSVNSTVRRILGSSSPKSKYRANIFTVSPVVVATSASVEPVLHDHAAYGDVTTQMPPAIQINGERNTYTAVGRSTGVMSDQSHPTSSASYSTVYAVSASYPRRNEPRY